MVQSLSRLLLAAHDGSASAEVVLAAKICLYAKDIGRAGRSKRMRRNG
jgi:hypothetical protein